MKSPRDTLLDNDIDLVDWTFDEKVTSVFDDMVLRSVPGYRHMIEQISLLSRSYAQHNTHVYDLGCSTGVASRALASTDKDITIVAVDSSSSMLKKCKANLSDLPNINYHHADIEDIYITNTSVVVLNLTLQFITPDKRDALIARIYDKVTKGGILIISEKLQLESNEVLLEQLQLDFKRYNGYSELEIANKRQMLENSLIADSKETHITRLQNAGFEAHMVSQYLNFAVFIGVKN